MFRVMTAAVLLLAVVGTVVAAPVTYPLTGDNTKVTFTATSPDGKHECGFKKVTGDVLVIDGDLLKSKVTIEIDVDSVYGNNDKTTTILRSTDLLNAKDNPKAKFVSTKVTKDDKGYQVSGNLTLRGQTKPFTFPVEVTAKDDSLVLKSAFTMNRNDFGVSGEKGKVGDEVTVNISVNARK